MRLHLGLLLSGLVLASSSSAWGDTTSSVMCEQFAITAATKTVEPVATLDEAFAPAHHAPRNIPIEVGLSEGTHAFVHFPIVESGTYLIYATDADRMAGLETKNGDIVKTSSIGAPEACSDLLTGGLSADLNAVDPAGPMPIAIEFHEGAAETIRFIISRDPTN